LCFHSAIPGSLSWTLFSSYYFRTLFWDIFLEHLTNRKIMTITKENMVQDKAIGIDWSHMDLIHQRCPFSWQIRADQQLALLIYGLHAPHQGLTNRA
jgi:hypothetical protein